MSILQEEPRKQQQREKYYNAIPIAQKSDLELRRLAEAFLEDDVSTTNGGLYGFIYHKMKEVNSAVGNALERPHEICQEFAVCITDAMASEKERLFTDMCIQEGVLSETHCYCTMAVLDCMRSFTEANAVDPIGHEEFRHEHVLNLLKRNTTQFALLIGFVGWMRLGRWTLATIREHNALDNDLKTPEMEAEGEAVDHGLAVRLMLHHLRQLRANQIKFNEKVDEAVKASRYDDVEQSYIASQQTKTVAEAVAEGEKRFEEEMATAAENNEEKEVAPENSSQTVVAPFITTMKDKVANYLDDLELFMRVGKFPLGPNEWPQHQCDDLFQEIVLSEEEILAGECLKEASVELMQFISNKCEKSGLNSQRRMKAKLHIPLKESPTSHRFYVVLFVPRCTPVNPPPSFFPESWIDSTGAEVRGLFNIVFADDSSHMCDQVAANVRDILSNVFDVQVIAAAKMHKFPLEITVMDRMSENATIHDHPVEKGADKMIAA